MRILLLLLISSSTIYSQTGGNYFISQQDSSTWYKVGINKASDNINDTIYHNGAVSIGKNTSQAKLDINGHTYINDSLIYTKIQNTNNVEAYNVGKYSLNSPTTGALHITTIPSMSGIELISNGTIWIQVR